MAEIQSKILLYKKEGETPLEALGRFKRQNPHYENLPLTYAGRLDPMAEGLLLVLTGEECKKKDDYLKLNKEYEVEILFGVATDTGDILGIVTDLNDAMPNTEDIKNGVIKCIGKSELYPAYSSKTVEGKSLWQWAREGIFKKITSPGIVLRAEVISEGKIESRELLSLVTERVKKVRGDFRQSAVTASWEKIISSAPEKFLIVKVRVEATSGAYMRVFAEEVGKNTHTPSLAWSIKRTKIGDWTLENVVLF